MTYGNESLGGNGYNRDHFLSIVSHELRTPLTPVLMLASALELREELPADVREDLQVIRRNVELEAKLIDDLLDLTRIMRNALALRRQRVDVNDLARRAVAAVRGEMERKGLTLTLKLEATRHEVMGDGERIGQALGALIGNALKFTSEGGEIRVSDRNVEDRVVVEVSDTGVGIDPEMLSRIFEPFEMGTSWRQSCGMGVGLAIAKGVVELHGGRVQAWSDGTGRGATFVMELPAAVCAGVACGQAVTGGTGGTGKRILLVEDQEDTLRILQRILERLGYSVATAVSAGEAMESVERQRPDLVISDLGLPDVSGLELMKELKARYALTGIALSGYGMSEDLERSREAGFVEHLVKPIGVETLREAVERQVGEE